MQKNIQLALVSDPHLAGPLEVARGHPRAHLTTNPVANALMLAWDRWVWMNDPHAHNELLDDFIAHIPPGHRVIANGDFSCDSECVGMADPAAVESAGLALGKLRAAFGDRFHATLGDHELGKTSFIGGRGGLRLQALTAATGELGLQTFWKNSLGGVVLIGVTSSIVGLELLRRDALDTEWTEWGRIRAAHLAEIGTAFGELAPDQRVVLFCHDPSALPYLLEVPELAARVNQIECSVVGHLHSGIVFATARCLAGVPVITFLGTTAERWTRALRRARLWRPFKPILCPALAGIELTGRGGWLELELDAVTGRLVRSRVHALHRRQR